MKLPNRRQFLHLAAGAGALPALSRLVWAQSYPSRPITIVVPFAAGGGTDVVGRIIAERLRVSLGQPVIIENVTGANGSIGAVASRALHPMATRSSTTPGIRTSRTAPSTRFNMKYRRISSRSRRWRGRRS
jgi:tripartite-type tricarboxylate transporter receptor subunit TctC